MYILKYFKFNKVIQFDIKWNEVFKFINVSNGWKIIFQSIFHFFPSSFQTFSHDNISVPHLHSLLHAYEIPIFDNSSPLNISIIKYIIKSMINKLLTAGTSHLCCFSNTVWVLVNISCLLFTFWIRSRGN